jgi:hypothetical protein
LKADDLLGRTEVWRGRLGVTGGHLKIRSQDLARGMSEPFSHVQIYSELQAYYLSAGCCPFPLFATLSFVRFPSGNHALPKIIQ